jgi:TonB family protein
MGLDERALAAAKEWEYQPFQPTAQRVFQVIDIAFELEPVRRWRIATSKFRFPNAKPGSIPNPVFSQYADPGEAACTAGHSFVPVDLQLEKDGKPSSVRVGIMADEKMIQAVREAAEEWRFQPGTGGGNTVSSSGTVLLECRAPGTVDRRVNPGNPGVLRIGGPVSAPAVAMKVDPEYSEEARLAKYSGVVILNVVVDGDGRARDIQVTKSLGMGLDEEAILAVNQWRFRPGMRDGQPVLVRATIEVNFRLL